LLFLKVGVFFSFFFSFFDEDGAIILELIALGTHENFYRDVKKLF